MKKLLIVDDETGFREQLELAMSRAGYEVYSAGSGQEAIEIGVQHRPDVLICDWMLQDEIHGLHVIEVLSAVYPSIKSMLMTGFASGDLREKANEQGLFGFFEKPFEIGVLKEEVHVAAQAPKPDGEVIGISILQVGPDNSIQYANAAALQLFYGLGFDIVAAHRNLAAVFAPDCLASLESSDEQWVEVFLKSPNPTQLYLRSRPLSENGSTLYVVLQVGDRSLQNYSVVRMLLGLSRRDAGRLTELDISGHVLVVDDYEMIRRMTCEMLEDQGYTCHCAGTHEEAMQVLQKDEKIGLVLLDYSMPDGDPKKLIEEIRQTRAGIIVVGSSGGNHREDFEDRGVGLFLPKPWITQDLQNVLNGIM